MLLICGLDRSACVGQTDAFADVSKQPLQTLSPAGHWASGAPASKSIWSARSDSAQVGGMSEGEEAKRRRRRSSQEIATLGRLDLLEVSGQLERMMRSGLRHCESFAVIDAHAAGEIEPVAIRRIRPDLVFARLWKESGIPEVLRSVSKGSPLRV